MKTQLAAAALALCAVSACAQSDTASAHVILTVLPTHPDTQSANLNANQLELKVNGKAVTVTSLTQVSSQNSPLELVLLIDSSVRTSLWGQAGDIIGFVKEIPSNTQIAVAYMQNGRAALEGPFSSDPATVDKGLHVTGGSAGSNASPYFCLSDLAKHWPSKAADARHAVVMITDGVDEYDQGYDPDDPNVLAAIHDSVQAGIVVFTMYWRDKGSGGSSEAESTAGQNLMLQVASATGGNSYWNGSGNPVSLQPYFDDLRRRLRNEYELSFTAPFKGKPTIADFKLKANAPDAKVTAPQFVFLSSAAAAQ